MNQLPIPFEYDLTKDIKNLEDSLNESLLTKEKYVICKYYQSGNFIILCARIVNEKFCTLFNVIDKNGKTPDGFIANWRTANHIFSDFRQINKPLNLTNQNIIDWRKIQLI